MKYLIKFVQEGGLRSYPIAALEFPTSVEKAMTAEELTRDMELPAAKQRLYGMLEFHMKRAAGWAYFNSLIADGSTGAEIGVDLGDGAARFLEMNPGRVYLVDPWVPWDDAWSRPQDVMDQRYRSVCSRFKDKECVTVKRQSSAEFFQEVEPGSLDWIFIDADHNKEAVREDLEGALMALKVGGHIGGDDLHSRPWDKDIGAALFEFRKAHKDEVNLLWNQYDPYVVRKIK